MKLDLAAGQRPLPGFTPVDRVKVSPDTIVTDLVSGQRWPFEDSSIEELACRNFVEHIPAEERLCWHALSNQGMKLGSLRLQDLLFWFFDEAYRIIVPGGLFHVSWPALKSSDAFRDPTHRRFLPLEFTYYLSKSSRKTMYVDHYVVECDWVVIDTKLAVAKGFEDDHDRFWDAEREITVTLRAEK